MFGAHEKTMSTAACFENIIGLSRRDCPCVEDRTVDAGVSESGLYLDELPGLNLRLLDTAADCGDDGLWAKLERARENAIEDTIAELGACIAANTDTARPPGTSIIGQDKNAARSSVKLPRTYHGLAIETALVRGGICEITAIGTAFKAVNNTGTVAVKVYNRPEESADPIAEVTLNTTPDRVIWTDLPEPIALTMQQDTAVQPRFWILYEPNGMEAMNTEINCGCVGYKPYWSHQNPQYTTKQDKGVHLWAWWAMAAGTKGDDLSGRLTWTVENPTHGLLLKVRLKCDEVSSFCDPNADYRMDPIQKVIAHAVRFKAGANLLQDILTSPRIDRFTMTAGEQLEALKKDYEAEFEKRVGGFLCPTLSGHDSINRYGDCRKCKDTWGMGRGTIPN